MIESHGGNFIGVLMLALRTVIKRNITEKRSIEMPYTIINETSDGVTKRYGEFETEIEAVNSMKKEARLAVETLQAVAPGLNVTLKEEPELCIVRLNHEGKSHVAAQIKVIYTED